MKVIAKNIGIPLLLCLLLFFLYSIFSKESSIASYLSKASDYSAIEKKGRLVVVTDYSPIGYFIKGDTVAGFNYDLLQLFQGYTDAAIEIELETSIEKSLAGLASGKYNIIARSMPITSELKSKVLFSNPITQNKQILVQRKEEFNNGIAPLRSHLDLASKTIYVPKNSPAILRIKNLAREIGDTIHYKEDAHYGPEQLAIMVAQNEIDFAICDEKTAKRIAESQPELDIATMIGFTQLEAWAVSKDSSVLLDSLNAWIDRAKTTKKYNYLQKLYYH